MRFPKKTVFFLLVVPCLAATMPGFAQAKHAAHSSFVTVSAKALEDKIAGGMLGQLLGNLNGLKYEFKFLDTPGTVANYVPSLPDGAFSDDDTDIEWVYLTEMAKTKTVKVPPYRIAQLWQTFINHKIWSANRFARQLIDLDIEPPLTGKRVLNNWAGFNIAGMFLSETFGLCAPFMPQAAARTGVHYTAVSVDGEPLQATQLITAMIATAFRTSDVNEIVTAGKASVDPKSEVYDLVGKVQAWCRQYPHDWQKIRQLIRDAYTNKELVGGARHVRNMNGYNLNAAATVAAVLLGKGDFVQSLTHAFNFGWDADCNAATVGAVAGVINGKAWMDRQGWQIKDKYENLTREGMPVDETISGFTRKVMQVAELVVVQEGGGSFMRNGQKYFRIKAQAPQNVLALTAEENERSMLASQLREKILAEYKSLDMQTAARAAYLAIVTDVYKEIKQADEGGWRKAVAALQTYPRVIDILLKTYPDPAAPLLSRRATEAGVKKPAVPYKWPADY